MAPRTTGPELAARSSPPSRAGPKMGGGARPAPRGGRGARADPPPRPRPPSSPRSPPSAAAAAARPPRGRPPPPPRRAGTRQRRADGRPRCPGGRRASRSPPRRGRGSAPHLRVHRLRRGGLAAGPPPRRRGGGVGWRGRAPSRSCWRSGRPSCRARARGRLPGRGAQSRASISALLPLLLRSLGPLPTRLRYDLAPRRPPLLMRRDEEELASPNLGGRGCRGGVDAGSTQLYTSLGPWTGQGGGQPLTDPARTIYCRGAPRGRPRLVHGASRHAGLFWWYTQVVMMGYRRLLDVLRRRTPSARPRSWGWGFGRSRLTGTPLRSPRDTTDTRYIKSPGMRSEYYL